MYEPGEESPAFTVRESPVDWLLDEDGPFHQTRHGIFIGEQLEGSHDFVTLVEITGLAHPFIGEHLRFSLDLI